MAKARRVLFSWNASRVGPQLWSLNRLGAEQRRIGRKKWLRQALGRNLAEDVSPKSHISPRQFSMAGDR
jgi:hypothetical protein